MASIILSGFCILILFIGLVSIVFFATSTTNAVNEKERTTWQSLAETNRLAFVLKGARNGRTRVTGKYRGYHLELDISYKSWNSYDHIYTSLVLFAKSRPTEENGLGKGRIAVRKKVAPKDIVSLLAPSGLHYRLKGKINVNPKARKIHYEQRGVETDAEYLQFLFDLFSDIMDNYLNVLDLGGEIGLALQAIATDRNQPLQPIAVQLLRDIAQETKYQLRPKISYALCSRCLTRCHPHKVRLPWWDSVTYYGCRSCGQSNEFIEWRGSIIVVLDREMIEKEHWHNGTVVRNWLSYHKLFDFDQVQIIQASDEDVERFAVQVGNDTDPVRKPRYKQITCTIAPDCELSENTMRILRNTFGKVEFSTGHF